MLGDVVIGFIGIISLPSASRVRARNPESLRSESNHGINARFHHFLERTAW